MTLNAIKADEKDIPDWEPSPEIFALSAWDKKELKSRLLELRNCLAEDPSLDARHRMAAKTRQSFSATGPVRLLVVMEPAEDPGSTCEKAVELLDSHPEENRTDGSIFLGEDMDYGKLAFIFPGQGSQYVTMGKDLINGFPEARRVLTLADEIFGRTESLSGYIFPLTAKEDDEKSGFEDRLRSTDIAQPAIGVISLAMVKVLRRFGVIPDSTCGHSFGELSALYSSGRISEASFLSLSVARGNFMAAAGKGKDSGTMLAVKAPLDQIDELLKTENPGVVLANRNSPDQGVLSGPTEAILRMKSVLKEHKIRSTVLPVAAAFHSALVMDAALPFQDALEKIEFMESPLPVYSNTTGQPYPVLPTQAKKLLGAHLIHPVHFMDEIENMYKDGVRIFVEVGPKPVLTGLVKSILKEKSIIALAVDGSSGKRSGMSDLAKVLCRLACAGYPVDIKQWRAVL